MPADLVLKIEIGLETGLKSEFTVFLTLTMIFRF